MTQKDPGELFFAIFASFTFYIFHFLFGRCRYCCRRRANWSRQQQLDRCHWIEQNIRSNHVGLIMKNDTRRLMELPLFLRAAACLFSNVLDGLLTPVRKRESDSIVLNCVSRTQYAVALLGISSGGMIVAWPIYRRLEWY